MLVQLPRKWSLCLLSLSMLAAAAPACANGSGGGHRPEPTAAAAHDPRLEGSYKFTEGGWTYVHLQGTPEQVGFQHGYLLAREIEDNVHVYTVTGKVMDSDMAAKLSFIGRAGHPCGADFIAAPFLAAHPEFAWQKPILHDMKAGPWTTFVADEKK